MEMTEQQAETGNDREGTSPRLLNGFSNSLDSPPSYTREDEMYAGDTVTSEAGRGKDTKRRSVVALNNNNNYTIPPECSRSCTTEKLYFHRFNSVEGGDSPSFTPTSEMDISTGHIVLVCIADISI